MHNILFDCEKIRYPNTGVHTFCEALGQSLKDNIDPDSEQLHYYIPAGAQGLFGQEASYVRQHRWHKYFNTASRNIKVWHCTYQLSNYLPSARRTRMVLTIHDLNFLIDTSDSARVRKYKKKLQQVVNRADYVACISDYTLQSVKEHMVLGDRPTGVIHNGCKASEFPGYDSPLYRPDKKFIFSLGTFFPKKNFHVLPALLRDNDYELIIAGSGIPDYAEVILKRAAYHRVADRVKLIGVVSEKDKYWYYLNCAAFAFPSLAEGFGLPVLEAMHFGKPVFLSTSTSLPEIGGDVAYYFDNFEPDDMQRVFTKGMSSFSIDSSAAVKAWANRFTWEKAAQAYVKVYRQLY